MRLPRILRRRPQVNPYEAQHRTAKAVRIADFIERACRSMDRETYERFVGLIDLAPSDYLEVIGRLADERTAPSRATWDQVGRMLRERFAYNLTQRAARARV